MKITRTRKVRPAPAVVEKPVQLIAKDKGEESESRAQSSRVDYDAVIARYMQKANNRKNAIRAKCVECMGGMVGEVARCTCDGCPLHPYRMGENPHDQRTIKARAKKECEPA